MLTYTQLYSFIYVIQTVSKPPRRNGLKVMLLSRNQAEIRFISTFMIVKIIFQVSIISVKVTCEPFEIIIFCCVFTIITLGYSFHS